MPIEIGAAPNDYRGPPELEALRDIPVSIIGDELNRTNITYAALRPLAPGSRFAGVALTVECMTGDNSALHYALVELKPGAVIIADARGHVDTAVWGEIMHTCAKARGAVAVVIDGSMRDASAIAASGLPAYSRGVTPRGPHKGWGGSVNLPIQCAGVSVRPGDLVLGDDDGVIVVRPDQLPGLVDRCRARMQKEADVLARVSKGETTVEVFAMPSADKVGR